MLMLKIYLAIVLPYFVKMPLRSFDAVVRFERLLLPEFSDSFLI